MARKKLTNEQRVKAVQEYLAGNGSYGQIDMVLLATTEGIESIKSERNGKYPVETRKVGKRAD